MLAKVIRFLALLSILVVLFPHQVSAAGVGASPGKLDFNVHSSGSATKTLYVINTGGSQAHYKVYVDEEYENWFDFAPDEFSLPPRANQRILITVSPPLVSVGSCDTCLYIVTTGSSSPFRINVGIKVPIHIHIFNPLLLVGVGIIAALIIAMIVFLIRRHSLAKSKITTEEGE